MKNINELFDKLFLYYLITDRNKYSTRLTELRWRIKLIKVDEFSLNDIYTAILETSNFFPTVVNFNDAMKKLKEKNYEILIKGSGK